MKKAKITKKRTDKGIELIVKESGGKITNFLIESGNDYWLFRGNIQRVYGINIDDIKEKP